MYPDAYAEFLEPRQSDHSVCLFRVPSHQRRVCKPFKFFHHIIDHPEYADSVKEAWNCEVITGSYQFKFVRSLKSLKKVLRRINKRHYSGISERVKEMAGKIEELQRSLLSNPDLDTAVAEHQARGKWQILQKAEEKYYRQRSRVRWMNLGDRNTAFFHKTVLQRVTRNHIHFLKDAEDKIYSTTTEIKEHSAAYFRDILGSTTMPESSCTVTQLQELLQFRCSDI